MKITALLHVLMPNTYYWTILKTVILTREFSAVPIPCARKFVLHTTTYCLLQQEHRCIHCKLSTGPNAQYPEFKSINKLRQHISVHHSENPCFFCGRLFMTTQELYTHQNEHCPTTYKCGVCDTQFATMSAKNNHQAQHISALRTCSTSSHPSQVQHNHTWHDLNYRLRPWDRDARKLIGMGVLQTKINNLYNLKKGK